MVIAHHLILTSYGHWLPNDPSGGTSTEIRSGKLFALGSIHPGRKQIQPTRDDLKSFYRDVPGRLEHPILWFDAPKPQLIADAFAETCLAGADT